jgi:hypothetical protein
MASHQIYTYATYDMKSQTYGASYKQRLCHVQ